MFSKLQHYFRFMHVSLDRVKIQLQLWAPSSSGLSIRLHFLLAAMDDSNLVIFLTRVRLAGQKRQLTWNELLRLTRTTQDLWTLKVKKIYCITESHIKSIGPWVCTFFRKLWKGSYIGPLGKEREKSFAFRCNSISRIVINLYIHSPNPLSVCKP